MKHGGSWTLKEATQKSHVVYSTNSEAATEHQKRIYLQIVKTERRFSEVTLPHMVTLPYTASQLCKGCRPPHWGLSPTHGGIFTGDIHGNRI